MPATLTTPSPDSELLSRFVHSRDEEAFASLMKKHWGFVFTIARRSLGNDALAEDAAQQAFIALSRRANKVSKNSALGPWLYRTVSHEASNLRRREQRLQKRNQDYAALASQKPEKNDPLSEKLYRALSSLSEKEREVILLRFYENLTADQIAEKLKISPAAAQRRTHRALERLSNFANAEDQDEESFQLSLPLLLTPAITPPKSALSEVLSSKAALGGSLLLPAAGWLVATTLSVSAVRQISPEPSPSVDPPITEQQAPRTRTLRDHSSPAPLPDDPDLAEFVTLIRTSSDDPFTWSRERFPHLGKEDAFLKKAFRFMAENDLPLAKNFLETCKTVRHRHPLIDEIVRVEVASDIPTAVLWMESLPHQEDRRTCCDVNILPNDPTERYDQYKSALQIATEPMIRTWLAGIIADHYESTDETKLLEFAGTLQGEAKLAVLYRAARIQLDRDHPSANELIRQLEGNLSISRHDVVRRNPGRYLEAILPFAKDDYSKIFEARYLADDWFELDPEGLRTWAAEKDPANILKLPPHQRTP